MNWLKGAESGVYVCGQEKTLETVKLAKMNLAVNGLRGEIKQANTYYEDPLRQLRRLRLRARQSAVQRRRREPPAWRRTPLQHLRHPAQQIESEEGRRRQGNRAQRQLPVDQPVRHLAQTEGRAALVMANSASDARHSEADIRRKR
jgi:type I restriction enzyme M protein